MQQEEEEQERDEDSVQRRREESRATNFREITSLGDFFVEEDIWNTFDISLLEIPAMMSCTASHR